MLPLDMRCFFCCVRGEGDLCGCVGLVIYPRYSEYGPWRDSISITQDLLEIQLAPPQTY